MDIIRQHLITQSQHVHRGPWDQMGCVQVLKELASDNTVPSFKTHGNQAELNKNWNKVNGHCKKADKYNENTDLFEPV